MDAVRRGKKGLTDPLVQVALREFLAGLSRLYAGMPPDLVAYGSYARNEATEDSDLDLLLVYSRPVNPSLEIRHLVSLLADLNLRYGVLFSVLPVSADAYQQAQGPFWRNLRREGVPIRVNE
jgi:uncharacterized protein